MIDQGWMEHQRMLREDRANGRGRDDREVDVREDDEVHELPPGLDRVTRTREEAESDELQDRRAEYHMNPGQHDLDAA